MRTPDEEPPDWMDVSVNIMMGLSALMIAFTVSWDVLKRAGILP